MTIRITTVPRAIKEFGPPAEWPEWVVYVGRAAPRYGLRASPLANPWGPHLRDDRYRASQAKSVSLYRRYLEMRRPRDADTGELKRLRTLLRKPGKLVLVCWCFDSETGKGKRPCHAEVIREVLEARPKRRSS